MIVVKSFCNKNINIINLQLLGRSAKGFFLTLSNGGGIFHYSWKIPSTAQADNESHIRAIVNWKGKKLSNAASMLVQFLKYFHVLVNSLASIFLLKVGESSKKTV